MHSCTQGGSEVAVRVTWGQLMIKDIVTLLQQTNHRIFAQVNKFAHVDFITMTFKSITRQSFI